VAVSNPVINDPTNGSNIVRVGMDTSMVWTPGHVVIGGVPVGRTGAAFRASKTSGTHGTDAANGEQVQFRFATNKSRVCIVVGVAVSAGVSAAGLADLLDLHLRVARGWSTALSSASQLDLTTPYGKLANKLQTPNPEATMAMPNTGVLSAGTKTLDASYVASVSSGFGTGAATTQPIGVVLPKTYLIGDPALGQGWPLVLEDQEGFVIQNGAQIRAGAWNLSVEVSWVEVDSF
jgi:hypothetical protein